MTARTRQADQDFQKGLADDLNTAQALAAIFDLVRDANTAIDRKEFRQGDALPILGTLEKFDAIFAVLADDDAEKLRALGFEVARAVGLFRRQLDIRVLMDEQNAPAMRSLIQEWNPAVADTVIQIGGVLKNIIAIACGIGDGMGAGVSAPARGGAGA